MIILCALWDRIVSFKAAKVGAKNDSTLKPNHHTKVDQISDWNDFIMK